MAGASTPAQPTASEPPIPPNPQFAVAVDAYAAAAERAQQIAIQHSVSNAQVTGQIVT